MKNARKLQGINIYINDDLCAASQTQRNIPQLKEGRAQGKVAYIKKTNNGQHNQRRYTKD